MSGQNTSTWPCTQTWCLPPSLWVEFPWPGTRHALAPLAAASHRMRQAWAVLARVRRCVVFVFVYCDGSTERLCRARDERFCNAPDHCDGAMEAWALEAPEQEPRLGGLRGPGRRAGRPEDVLYLR
jgi:hypothetical protein